MRKLFCLLLVLTLVLGSAATAFAAESKGSAASVKLEKYSGTVTLTNASGKEVTPRSGMRVYAGYTVKTGLNSSAYLSLDSSKALMLESSTTVKLKKSGNKIDVMLESGTVVADVSQKVDSNGSLDIHTTNNVTGIRGTGVESSYDPAAGVTSIAMLDGTTENYSKFDDQNVQVRAGQAVSLGGDGAAPAADSIALGDLKPETQQLLVVDDSFSGAVGDAAKETFGLNTMSAAQLAALQGEVNTAVADYNAQQQAAQDGADSEADAIMAAPVATNNELVDPVFTDQEEEPDRDTGSSTPRPTPTPEPVVEPTTYTVTFNSNGGSEVTVQTVEEGKTASKPADPTKDGCEFLGWYSDSALTAAYDFSAAVNSDITLYAGWKDITFTVRFFDAGKVVSTITVKSGTKASEPTVSKEGYSLLGWFEQTATDVYAEEAYDLSLPVTKDLDLYTQWAKQFTVTFFNSLTNAEHEGYTQSVIEGGFVTEPSDPTLKGYTFDGWYLEEAKEPFAFDGFEVTQNIIINSWWTPIDYYGVVTEYNEAESVVTVLGSDNISRTATSEATSGEIYIGALVVYQLDPLEPDVNCSSMEVLNENAVVYENVVISEDGLLGDYTIAEDTAIFLETYTDDLFTYSIGNRSDYLGAKVMYAEGSSSDGENLDIVILADVAKMLDGYYAFQKYIYQENDDGEPQFLKVGSETSTVFTLNPDNADLLRDQDEFGSTITDSISDQPTAQCVYRLWVSALDSKEIMYVERFSEVVAYMTTSTDENNVVMTYAFASDPIEGYDSPISLPLDTKILHLEQEEGGDVYLWITRELRNYINLDEIDFEYTLLHTNENSYIVFCVDTE